MAKISKTNVSFFTIDKDPISGLSAQTVAIADYTDIFVKDKTINGLFTNMQFALSWNRKASGAVVKCDYQLVPLEKLMQPQSNQSVKKQTKFGFQAAQTSSGLWLT